MLDSKRQDFREGRLLVQCIHEEDRQFWKDCEIHAPTECFKTVCEDCDTVTYRDCEQQVLVK